MVGGFRGADGNTPYGIEELHPVYSEDVGVVLRDDRAVVRILADHEAADHSYVSEAEYGDLLVEVHVDFSALLAEETLEDVGVSLVQNERRLSRGVDVVSCVADELLEVGRNHRSAVRLDVEVDTVHHRPVVLV